MYDVKYLDRIEKKKKKNRELVEEWIQNDR